MVITGITDQLPGLVNCYITMERSTIFNGKIHYKWGIFNSYVSHYQRVGSLWSLAPQEPSFLLAQCHLRIADLLCLQVQHSSTHCLEDPILCHAMPWSSGPQELGSGGAIASGIFGWWDFSSDHWNKKLIGDLLEEYQHLHSHVEFILCYSHEHCCGNINNHLTKCRTIVAWLQWLRLQNWRSFFPVKNWWVFNQPFFGVFIWYYAVHCRASFVGRCLACHQVQKGIDLLPDRRREGS